MATHPQDAVDLSVPGVYDGSLILTASHPTEGLTTVYDAAGAGWAAGWNGMITADGDGGYDFALSLHPPLTGGLWTFVLVALSNSGLSGGGTWAFTVITVNTPPIAAISSPISGAEADPAAQIAWTAADVDDGINPTSLTMDAYSPSQAAPVVTLPLLAAGSWAAGCGGTIEDDGTGLGFSVACIEHPVFIVDDWEIVVSCEDMTGESATDSVAFSTVRSSSYLQAFGWLLPPWLLRTEGLKFFRALSDVIDDHRDRLVAGIKLRFPGLYTLDGVDKIGRERRLRRGPNESAAVYAARLRRWWEDHRTRGNGYALLEQMLAYLVDLMDPPYDVVSYLGVRHTMDSSGVITRDTITWGNDETGMWARLWVFLYDPNVGPVDAATLEAYAAIVRDWIPAHISSCTLVVIHPDTRLWDYPQPVPDWDDTWDWDDGPTTTDVVEV